MLVDISVVVIASVMIMLLICVICLTFRITRTLRKIDDLTETIRMHVAPVSHDLTIISQKISGIIASVERQVLTVEDGVDTIKVVTHRIRHWEDSLLKKITSPFFNITSLFAAFRRGFSTFFKVLRD